jgi:hypothetical protein
MMQLTKDANYPFPEDGDHGDYVRTIAQEIVEKYNNSDNNIDSNNNINSLLEDNENNLETIKKYGEE